MTHEATTGTRFAKVRPWKGPASLGLLESDLAPSPLLPPPPHQETDDLRPDSIRCLGHHEDTRMPERHELRVEHREA